MTLDVVATWALVRHIVDIPLDNAMHPAVESGLQVVAASNGITCAAPAVLATTQGVRALCFFEVVAR